MDDGSRIQDGLGGKSPLGKGPPEDGQSAEKLDIDGRFLYNFYKFSRKPDWDLSEDRYDIVGDNGEPLLHQYCNSRWSNPLIRIYSDHLRTEELLKVMLRPDFWSGYMYDVYDGQRGGYLGTLRNTSGGPLARECWKILDSGQKHIATVKEGANKVWSFFSRLLFLPIPPWIYHIELACGRRIASMDRSHAFFSPYSTLSIHPGTLPRDFDPRLLVATRAVIDYLDSKADSGP